MGETIAFEVTQDANRITINGDDIELYFAVDGITLPAAVDPSFAVWALLPRAMEEGFNLQFDHPIDPKVAANAELLSQIWEMWTPDQYRSISIRGRGDWSRSVQARLPEVRLFSGGIDATFAILKDQNLQDHRFAATVCGVDKITEANLADLVAKTEPILKSLNYSRIIIRTNAKRKPNYLTHGFTLAGCLFLLSDLFEQGTLAADSTPAEELATHPWGSNRVTNEYFAGADFAVRTVGGEIGRTEKIATIVRAGIDPHLLSFCRERKVIPANCGMCAKCLRTKAMFLIATGSVPDIFIDNSLDESLMRRLLTERNERVALFDLYFYAKKHDILERLPSLVSLIEKCHSSF
jgi:hypothetical protein